MVVLTHVPTRTCVGCRTKASPNDLIRLVCDTEHEGTDQGTVVVDRFRRLPGRGAWVHANESCLRAASSPGRLSRALRRQASFSADALREALDLAE